MEAVSKILGFAVDALIVVALGFYFTELYAPSPANPTLSAAIQQESIPIGSMTREFLEYVPHHISPHSPLVIVLHGSLMDAKWMREWTGYEFDQLADQHGFVVVYPDGYKHAWNDCHSEATFAAHTENIDDMGFVKGLIARGGQSHTLWVQLPRQSALRVRYRADVCEATRCDFCPSRDSPRPTEERRPHLSGWIPVAWRSFSGRCTLRDRGRWACGSSARVQIPAHPGPYYDCRRYAEADD